MVPRVVGVGVGGPNNYKLSNPHRTTFSHEVRGADLCNAWINYYSFERQILGKGRVLLFIQRVDGPPITRFMVNWTEYRLKEPIEEMVRACEIDESVFRSGDVHVTLMT